MKYSITYPIAVLLTQALFAGDPLIIDTQVQWEKALTTAKDVIIENGTASAAGKTGNFTATLHKSDRKRSVASLTVQQSALWQNWEAKPRVGPKNLRDAPVFLSMGPDNYWMFGRYGPMPGGKGKKPAGAPAFEARDAQLDGLDIALKTTPLPNQFNAPGGLVKGQGGYHAWQSKDMVHWVHHGCVTPGFARWVTTAEQVDGKTFIYYDFPNDQDPHLFIDTDLTDGKPGKNMGIALNDPSHGSDCAVIRDIQGKFHIIFEDWSPINARKHSWDSPLAGHAVSQNGIDKFSILAPAVDERTKPTGKIAEYLHPHWKGEDPKRFKTNVAKYEIHEPKQNAYGDWASIAIGGQYYLFCDYHPANKGIRIAWFTSSSINKPFSFCDEIGKGHPDPDIGFAEGRFYLVTQTSNDYVSPGPWVEKIEARVGVDTDNDGKVNQWTKWTEVKETYDYIPGFSKQIKRTPAAIDLAGLPAGYAFHADLKISDTTENKSKPIIESLHLSFK